MVWARLCIAAQIPGSSVDPFVADVPIPEFSPQAEIICWGQRFFTKTDKSIVDKDGRVFTIYEEGMVWYVPSEKVRRSLGEI